MDPRSPPWVFTPGIDYSRDDTRPDQPTKVDVRKLTGFDIEVMEALARRMGAAPRIVPTSWGELEGGLVARRFDLILCGWTPNPATPPGILASDPYHHWGLLIAIRADNATTIRSVADLDGKRVGHFVDPAVHRGLSAMGHGHFEARTHPTTLFRDLVARTLDAVIFDSLYVRWRVANDPSLRVVGPPLNRLGYHVAVRKEDAVLFAKVQAAVKDLTSSEEMARIRTRWEGPADPDSRR
jgi:ABC-type amino acid transport substrate-binding protein